MASDTTKTQPHDSTPDAATNLKFQARRPQRHLERLKRERESQGIPTEELQTLFLGIAANQTDNGVDIGFCVNDGTYSIDFAVETLPVAQGDDIGSRVREFVLRRITEYVEEHKYKFKGAGVSLHLDKLAPDLAAGMWMELDIVALVLGHGHDDLGESTHDFDIDEEADSMARKCVMRFGPLKQPVIQVGFPHNQVGIDAGGFAHLVTLDMYKESVGERTWEATQYYAHRLKQRDIKIAFFNATPQGGGVALMRHALIRFLNLLGVKVSWYVPSPKPQVFRITKTNHNILQGVADPKERLNDEQIKTLAEWTERNAQRHWLKKGGPLAAVRDGGADLVVIDDPQMPSLVPLAKKADPDRPVIFRSHIQIRSDLVDEKPDSPTAGVFAWLYNQVKEADMFVSHPVKAFVPNAVKPETVAYLPATTDWLDGLNKPLREYDTRYYQHEYNKSCKLNGIPQINPPSRPYIVQIARFDPSKGIPTVVHGYGHLRRNYMKDLPRDQTPQLVIAGHGSIDDPDASIIYDETMKLIEEQYPELRQDISVMRIDPIDQFLNVLMSEAKVALQLSTREGFEVKVSEALHKGVPIIASRAGGIPLQVEHGKSGFLVEPDDADAVAKHLHELFTDHDLYVEMSKYAATHVSDEVGTVGNALAWMYLADRMTDLTSERLVPRGKWVNDLAREAAGVPYVEGETRLPRHLST